MFDPRTSPRPKIRERDIVVRKDTEQPRGIVILPIFVIEDANLRGVRSAPVQPGWYALVMWHNRERLVAELADGLTSKGNLNADE
jgi:hypothetical protein